MFKDLHNVFSFAFSWKVVAGVITTILSFFFDALLAKVFLIVIVLTLIDCFLGYTRALKNNKAVVSRVMYRYGWKFAGYMIAASALFLMDSAMPPAVQGLTGWLDDFALAFFAVHEAISILEHLNEMGVPLPTKILGNLKKVREQIDTEEQYHEKKGK